MQVSFFTKGKKKSIIIKDINNEIRIVKDLNYNRLE